MKATVLSIAAAVVLTVGMVSLNVNGQSGVQSNRMIAYVPETNTHGFKLLEFSVIPTSDGVNNMIYVKWTTEGESQIKASDIEQAKASNPKVWEPVATFPSSNQDGPITRTYTEKFPPNLNMTVYLRLKVYFLDGSVMYGPVRSATFGSLSRSFVQ